MSSELFESKTMFGSPCQKVHHYTIFINVMNGKYNIVVQDRTKSHDDTRERLPIRIEFETNTYSVVFDKAIEIYEYIKEHREIDEVTIGNFVEIPTMLKPN